MSVGILIRTLGLHIAPCVNMGHKSLIFLSRLRSFDLEKKLLEILDFSPFSLR